MNKEEMKTAIRDILRRYTTGAIDVAIMEEELIAIIDAGNVSIYKRPDDWIHLLNMQLLRYVHGIN